MDPPKKLDLTTDSSFFLIKKGLQLNHQLSYIIDQDLFVENGEALAYGYNPAVNRSELQLKNKTKVNLKDFDVIFFRKDPPFNMDYIYISYILEMVENDVLCINHPSSVLSTNEKFYAQNFADIIPQSLISKNPQQIQEFLKQFEKGIIKPLDNKGGEGIYLVKDVESNYKTINQATNNGKNFMLAQKYLKGIETSGDKRITMLNGDPINALLRIPKEGDFRGNISAGAKAVKAEITKKEQEICSKLAPILKEKQLYLVGLDFIDEKVTEINVTSPIIGFDLYPENADLIYDFLNDELASKIN